MRLVRTVLIHPNKHDGATPLDLLAAELPWRPTAEIEYEGSSRIIRTSLSYRAVSAEAPDTLLDVPIPEEASCL